MPLLNPLSARASDFPRDRSREGRRHSAAGRRSSRPRVELLEERMLLNVDMVTNSNDSGSGSLRYVMSDAGPETRSNSTCPM